MGCNIFWFRRDLRLHDNHGLYKALSAGEPVLAIFVFDRDILDPLDDHNDARVSFIYQEIKTLKSSLQEIGSDLKVFYLPMHSDTENSWLRILEHIPASAVFTNRDYEPAAIIRDEKTRKYLAGRNIEFHDFKDHVIFEKQEVCKDDGTPYTVFTPYKRKWLEKFDKVYQKLRATDSMYPSERLISNFIKIKSSQLLSLGDMGFTQSEIEIPGKEVAKSLISLYGMQRDYPYISGTSRLGIHFRFGTLSIRQKALAAKDLSEVFLSELIWRDFYSMILQAFPQVANHGFRNTYDHITWVNNERDFEKWCNGMTGFPLVDAGMRQLNTTGFMHNRVRMVAASFLVKHLLIDWHWGEAYFAKKLLDYDLASNNGGWQWCAGCGTDAAPYFRIFNPVEQQKKFDPDFLYVMKYVPEYGTADYPKAIVDHKMARERFLKAMQNI